MKVSALKKTSTSINPFTVVSLCLVLAAVMTWLIPAGKYELLPGTNIIDADSFHYIENSPISFWQLINSIYSGMVNSSNIIFAVILVGGYFEVIIQTGAIERCIKKMAQGAGQNKTVVIIVISVVMSILGAVGVMANAVIVMIPVGLILAREFKFDRMMAVGMTFVAAYCGFGMTPFGPATIQVAQEISGIPLLSGFGFRVVGWAVVLFVVIVYLIIYSKKPPEEVVEERPDNSLAETSQVSLSWRDLLVVLSLIVGLGIYTYGSISFNWNMEYMASTMLVISLVCAAFSKMSADKFVSAFISGARNLLYSAILIGMATAISNILTEGNILHTVIYSLSRVLVYLPKWVIGPMMFYINIIINFFVPSGSGQAALVTPIMAPLSDVLGIQRQMAVCAYQYGDGISNLIYPTNGTMMACIAAANITYKRWIKWLTPLLLVWMLVCITLMVIGILIGIS